MSRLKAVLFDLDETLIDRAASLDRYTDRFRERFGNDLDSVSTADLYALITRADGGGYRSRPAVAAEICQSLPWLSVPPSELVLRHWLDSFPAASVEREGATDLLKALKAKALHLGLVTNGSIRAQRAKIDHLGFAKYFGTIVISEAVGVEKPDPAIFAHALAELGVECESAAFLGDHPVNDVHGASLAGLSSVWLEGIHAWPADKPMHMHRIRRLDELPALLGL